MHDPKDLSQFAVDFLTTQGACAVGIATKETLAGGPPSTDLEYVLPGAKSAVSFAVPMDQEKIERYLAKEDHAGHQDDNFHTDFFATGLAVGLAAYWDQQGIPSHGCVANGVYRKDTPMGMLDFMPDISHRYLAVRSGVGWFGLSGNVITKTHGASVVLGSVVTTAELDPTDPLDEEEKYCDECLLCVASCQSGLMDKDERTSVTLGGEEFSYSKRRSYHRCDLVCAALIEALGDSAPRPQMQGGFHHPAMPPTRKINKTCGNCQLICHPDRDERKRRYKLLTEGGVVVQHENGTLEAVSPKIAEKHVSEMSPEQRACYEKD
jgi:epoxyqueuosine reductase QueG